VPGEYRNNHYVPVWYQKRFLLPNAPSNELFYLDLKPGTFTDPRGVVHDHWAMRRRGLSQCFAEDDLYVARFGKARSTALEQFFFGAVDTKGRRAVEYFTNFEHPSADGDAFNDMMAYMTVQKLRTPKGLGWLGQQTRTGDREDVLKLMVRLQQMYAALWTECVWLIADASTSATKFIMSDHPVTVYNRSCGPRSTWCRGYNDPDIGFHATQTVFPLSLEKVLLLTNLSWVRNPYQSERGMRPNPNPWRTAMFNFTAIQTRRHLSEQEVQQINFIIKSRALRYVGAANREWLHPDGQVSKADWEGFGDGYLLMPDPRAIDLGGEIFIGHRDGRVSHFDEYGRRPWQKDYGKESKERTEGRTLYRFKGEFARRYGPYRRGRTWEHGGHGDGRDSDDFHEYHLSLDKGKKHKKGF
jgi:hypothetical protein